jgi:hypothetical protein
MDQRELIINETLNETGDIFLFVVRQQPFVFVKFIFFSNPLFGQSISVLAWNSGNSRGVAVIFYIICSIRKGMAAIFKGQE